MQFDRSYLTVGQLEPVKPEASITSKDSAWFLIPFPAKISDTFRAKFWRETHQPGVEHEARSVTD